MTEHLSKPRLECFSVRALSPRELILSAKHLANCPFCRQQYQAGREVQRGGTTVRFTLAPEAWLRHEHFEYDQLVAFADNTMAADDQELAHLHLKICAVCREDVRSLLRFREQIAPELKISYGPAIEVKQAKASWVGWWRGLSWQLRYAAVILLIAIMAIASLALLQHRGDSIETRQDRPQTIEPGAHDKIATTESRLTNENATTTQPVPANEGFQHRGSKPNRNREAVAPNYSPIQSTLRDKEGIVAVSETGAVTGLVDVPASTRREVAVALRSQSLPRASVLDQLTDRSGRLRGRVDSDSFSLISPARAVIIEDHPLFKWQTLPSAESYRVFVTDSAGRVVAKSDLLPLTVTQWTASVPLNRGEIYSWAVVALADGKEIVSPNASTSEIRFQTLSNSDLEQLAVLRKSGSHLALGVFCARVGLIDEAEAEFKELMQLNPDSKLMNKFLTGLKRDH